ncbi:MAG TPA: hypothetical protein VJH03_04650 [Blastocatellia bacterium]|nr:hypothetical protein [Blastocatellia bacterium]
MISRTRASFIVAIVIGVFAVGIAATGGAVQAAWLRFYPGAVTIVVAAIAAWDHWLWRWTLVQRLPGVPRDIRGTWKGELDTFWKHETGTSPSRKVVYLVVRQTASQVSVSLLTNESRSASSLATVSSDGTTVSLDYLYLNWPDLHVQERSRVHHGSASLIVSGTPANRLRGQYWTNRDTKGELDFPARALQLAEDFDGAALIFRKAQHG